MSRLRFQRAAAKVRGLSLRMTILQVRTQPPSSTTPRTSPRYQKRVRSGPGLSSRVDRAGLVGRVRAWCHLTPTSWLSISQTKTTSSTNQVPHDLYPTRPSSKCSKRPSQISSSHCCCHKTKNTRPRRGRRSVGKSWRGREGGGTLLMAIVRPSCSIRVN